VTPQQIFRNVVVLTDLSDQDPMVSGDSHQLQQILVNTLINAAQAMEGEGTLSIRTETTMLRVGEGIVPRRRATDFRRRATDPKNEDYVSMRSSFPDAPLLKEGDRAVAITIKDSGGGITAEIADKIFDPFFTTKGPGEGTGLGLAIAHGIVEAHGGRIWFENPEGGGATFRILLPEKGNDRTTGRRGDPEIGPENENQGNG